MSCKVSDVVVGHRERCLRSSCRGDVSPFLSRAELAGSVIEAEPTY